MQQLTVTAPDISCVHCQHTIETELGTVPGIQSVSVDVAGKRVSVTYDPQRITETQIVARLDEEGYPVAP